MLLLDVWNDVQEAGGHEDSTGEAGQERQPFGSLPIGILSLFVQAFSDFDWNEAGYSRGNKHGHSQTDLQEPLLHLKSLVFLV